MRTGAVASTSKRSTASNSTHLFFAVAAFPFRAQPTRPLAAFSSLVALRQRPRARGPNGLAVAQAGQLPPASVRGGGGRGQAESASTLAIQPSTTTSTALSTSYPSPPSFSLIAVAAGSLLALAAAWAAATSFARERGAVSSSASAAGLRGGAAGRRRRRSAPAHAGNGALSSWPPPRSYRAALSVTRRSVALTRAVQAADFGNISAALTELDRALVEHAAAGGSWEERREETTGGGGGSEGSEAGRWPSPLPSGTGEDDVSLFSSFDFPPLRLHCSLPLALLRTSLAHRRNEPEKKKLLFKQMRRLYVLHLQNSENLFSTPEELNPLRSLLRLSEEEAKEIEDEVLSATSGFSI